MITQILPLSPETPHEKCNPLGYKPAEGSASLSATADTARQNQCHLIGDIPEPGEAAVLELRVRNHPGTMSHITGLFARRAFNLEAIVCVPVGDGAESCMLLLVADGPNLEQVEKQLLKLYDVLTVRHRPDLGPEFFSRFSQAALAGSPAPSA
jgi:acetolactate synthase-1/3 small subunit